MEKYISFSVGELRFIDFLQFLNTSLENLVDNLKKDGDDRFKILSSQFQDKKFQPYRFQNKKKKIEFAKAAKKKIRPKNFLISPKGKRDPLKR